MSWKESTLLTWLGRHPSRRDDAAHLSLDGIAWAFTVDQVVEGVHFHRDTPPGLAGRKLAARNLSDLAASGASAHHALLAITADAREESWMRAFITGVEAELRTAGAELVGGDLSSCPNAFVASLSLAGRVHGNGLRRSAARPGERLFVSGALGGASLGRHLQIRSRLAMAEALVLRFGVRAAMDLSDGLAVDLRRFASASGVGVVLHAAAIPVHEDAVKLAAQDGREALDHALQDGEDYELLFSSELDAEAFREQGLLVYEIGKTTADPGELRLMRDDLEMTWPSGGWEHGQP